MKLLYNTEPYAPLAAELLVREETEFKRGDLERDTFPDGEKYLRVRDHVKGTHCTILGGTTNTEDIFEILNLGYQLTTSGAKKLSIIIPCFGYQTMERQSNPGEVVMAKTMAHWLSSIPRAAYGNEIIILEPHTDTISQYFSPDVNARAISAMDIIIKACVELTGSTEFVLGSTDVGRAKALEYIQRGYANKGREYDVDTAFIYKRRQSGTSTEITGINADVDGKTVVIYDDMIRTGGSLLKAANIYRAEGAAEVYAMTTHGILPGDSADKIKKSGLIKRIGLTNSHPNAAFKTSGDPDFWRLFSVGGLLSRYG